MFNNVLDRKETFFGHKNSIFQSPKKPFFPKGLTHAFVQIMYFFLYLFLVKIRPEIMFNNVLDRKETFFGHKNSIFQSPKKPFFPKGLTHAFVQIMYFFLYLFLVKIRPEIMLNNVRDRKETSFCP